jgi:hypothetical protein
VEKVLDHRPKVPVGRRNKVKDTEILIKWVGYDADQNSWEPLSDKTIRELEQFAIYVRAHPELINLLPKS